LIATFRSWGAGLDQANSNYIARDLDRATITSYQLEDHRINALIHDSVLHALIFAARAKTRQEQRASAILAVGAADKITNIQSEMTVTGDVTVTSLLRALGQAARESLPDIRISRSHAGTELIPIQAGQAITQATLQAIDNAVKHSNFTTLDLLLDSPTPGTLSVQVIDNGQGFRLVSVPNNRIGISGSIVTRMSDVGGWAEIESALNAGTTVSLRWPK
jgi:signal transduction histidine kinase